jgi:hypothetical protein
MGNINSRSGDSITGEIETIFTPEFASAVRTAVNAQPEDQVIITTPQFVRPRNDPAPASPPSSPDEWLLLTKESKQVLKERGLRAWSQVIKIANELCWENVDDNGTHILMVFPGEWYSKIPLGLEIIDIFGVTETFVPGQTDDDIRFGCLSFGVVVPI